MTQITIRIISVIFKVYDYKSGILNIFNMSLPLGNKYEKLKRWTDKSLKLTLSLLYAFEVLYRPSWENVGQAPCNTNSLMHCQSCYTASILPSRLLKRVSHTRPKCHGTHIKLSGWSCWLKMAREASPIPIITNHLSQTILLFSSCVRIVKHVLDTYFECFSY